MELFIMALLEVVHVQLCFYRIQLHITMFQVLVPLELRWTVHHVKWMELFWVWSCYFSILQILIKCSVVRVSQILTLTYCVTLLLP